MNIIVASSASNLSSNNSTEEYKLLFGECWADVESTFTMQPTILEKNITDSMRQIETILSRKIVGFLEKVLPIDAIQFGPVVSIAFEGQAWEFRAVDENGRKAMLLCPLYFLIEQTIKYQGTLFLFNRDLFKRNDELRIIALLKVEKPLTIGEIVVKLDKLHTQFSAPGDRQMNYEMVLDALSFLCSCGAVFESNDMYTLTARGRMLS